MLRSLLLYLSELDSPKKLLTGNPLGRRLASRFIAGEELDDALRVVRRLNSEGFKVTLDCLGESVHEAAAADAACQTYLQLLDRLAAEKLDSHVSVKLTQLGLAIDEGLARRNLARLAESAARHNNFVRVDMEGSAFTDSTLRVFCSVDAPREVMGIAIQSYLRRTDADVDELLKRGVRIRLVKGAYKEPPEIAFPSKRDVDLSYRRLTERLLTSGIYHAIATHDERIIAATEQFARTHAIPPEKFEFQLLYGIRRQLQRALIKEGWRVRLYVPYGQEWYAYFMRRLAERPANVLFLMRNLFRA
ncbi:MAG: proline dehydrogenase family protein [Acidobacteriota bacterium]|nr:proline dehydrogenase family protein [Acidobacteriota bacterium]